MLVFLLLAPKAVQHYGLRHPTSLIGWSTLHKHLQRFRNAHKLFRDYYGQLKSVAAF